MEPIEELYQQLVDNQVISKDEYGIDVFRQDLQMNGAADEVYNVLKEKKLIAHDDYSVDEFKGWLGLLDKKPNETEQQQNGREETQYKYFQSEANSLKSMSLSTKKDKHKYGSTLDAISSNRSYVAQNLSDEEFEKELKRRQKITDQAYKSGQGSNWFQRRVHGLYKSYGNTLVDLGGMSQSIYQKTGIEFFDVSDRLQENIRELKLMEAEVPSNLKQTTFGRYVDYQGLEIEVDENNNFVQAYDSEGYKVDVDKNFVQGFMKSGKASEVEREAKYASLAQASEQLLLDVGVMLLTSRGTSLLYKGANLGRKGFARLGAATAGGTAFVQSFGDNYSQALDEYGGDPNKAANVAFLKSGVTATITALFPGVETAGMFQKASVRKLLKDFAEGGINIGTRKATNAVTTIAKEIVEENFDESASNVVDIIHGLDKDVINTQQFYTTTALSGLVSTPSAALRAYGHTRNSVITNGLYEAASSNDSYNLFNDILEESDQDESLKEEKRALVDELKSNFDELGDSLNENDKRRLTSLFVNRSALQEKLNSSELEEEIKKDLENRLAETQESIDEIISKKDDAPGNVATNEGASEGSGDSSTASNLEPEKQKVKDIIFNDTKDTKTPTEPDEDSSKRGRKQNPRKDTTPEEVQSLSEEDVVKSVLEKKRESDEKIRQREQQELNEDEDIDNEPIEVLNEEEQAIYDSLSPFEKSTNRKVLDGRKVRYKGERGTISVQQDGIYFNDELIPSALNEGVTNYELGLSLDEEVQQTTEENSDVLEIGNSVDAFGKTWSLVDVKYDENGKPKEAIVVEQEFDNDGNPVENPEAPSGKRRKLKSKAVLNRIPNRSDESDNTEGNVSENVEVDQDADIDAEIEELSADSSDVDLTPEERQQYEESERRSELDNVEKELAAAFDLVDERLNEGDVVEGNTKFTEPFDEGGADSSTVTGRKRNASLMARALDQRIPRKIKDALGAQEIKRLRELAKRRAELAKENAPNNVRKERTEAARKVREQKVQEAYERQFPGITAIKNTFKEHARNVLNALGKYGISIKIYETPQEYADAVRNNMKNPSQKHLESNGFYFNNVIHINPYPKRPRSTTVYHEAAHAIFDKFFKNNSNDAKLIHKTIMNVLENGNAVEKNLAVELKRFLSSYDNNPSLQHEEFFTELVGFLSVNEYKISKRGKNKIKEAINLLMKKLLNIDSFFTMDDDIDDVINMVNDIAATLSSGKDINKVRIFSPESIEKRLGYDPSLEKSIVNGVRNQFGPDFVPSEVVRNEQGEIVRVKPKFSLSTVDLKDSDFNSRKALRYFYESKVISDETIEGNPTPQPKFQLEIGEMITKRAKNLDNLKGNIDTVKKTFKTPHSLYEEFKSDFDQNGVTLVDLMQVYKGLDPNKTVEQYRQEAIARKNKLRDVLKQAGFDKNEIKNTLTVYSEVASSWARDTGRSIDEWWSDIIEDFRFSKDGSDILLDDNESINFQAKKVQKSIWEKLAELTTFPKSRKYRQQSMDEDVVEPSTPLQEDLDLHETPQGKSFFDKNKNVIRGARKITDNHRAIVYITSSANVATPIHELAHIYEMYMSRDDKAAYLNEVGQTEWNPQTTSEIFAIGFEKFLADGRKTDNTKLQKVFNNFAKWLADIYNGLFAFAGDRIILSEKMNRLYAKMFYSTILNPDEIFKESEKLPDEVRKDSKKYNRETMTEMGELFGIDFEPPYVRTTLAERSAEAVRQGLAEVGKAMQIALDVLNNNKSITPVELHGMQYAAMKVEQQINETTARLEEIPGDEDLANKLQNLRDEYYTLLSAISLGTSNAAYVVGAAAKRIQSSWFDPEVVVRQVKAANPKVKKKVLQRIMKLAKDAKKAEEKLNKHEGKLKERAFEKKKDKVDSNMRSALDADPVRKFFNKITSGGKSLNELQNDVFKRLKQLGKINFSSEKLFDDGNITTEAILIALEANPDITTIQQLQELFKQNGLTVSTQSIVKTLYPAIDLNKTLKSTDKLVDEATKRKEMVQREAKLIQDLRGLLGLDTTADTTENKEPKIKRSKQERLLRKIIEELKDISNNNNNSHNTFLLHHYLDQILTYYDSATIDELFGRGLRTDDSGKVLLENYIGGYLEARSKSVTDKKQTLQEEIEDINKFIEELVDLKKNGKKSKKSLERYYGILERLHERNNQDEAIIDDELFRLRADLSRKRAILTERASEFSELKVNRVLRELGNTPRALILAFDYSYMTYQLGLYTVRNLFSSNFLQQVGWIRDMVRASYSQDNFEKVMQKIDSIYDENTQTRFQQLGLRIPENDGNPNNVEEVLRTKTYLETVLNKWFGEYYNPLRRMRLFNDRGYTAYVKAMRLQEMANLSRGVNDTKVLRDMAERINTFTGNSRRFSSSENWNKTVNKGLDAAANLLIAPRLYVSIYKTFYELTNIPTLIQLAKNGLSREKTSHEKRIQQNYLIKRLKDNLHIVGAQAIAIAGLHLLMRAIGGDDEEGNVTSEFLDPYNSGFMKGRVGEKIITVSPYATYLRAGVRVGTKAVVDLNSDVKFNTRGGTRKQSMYDALMDEFFKYRFNPLFNSVDLLVYGEDFLDRKVESETTAQFVNNRLVPSLAPISLQTLSDNIYKEKYGNIVPDFFLDMAGVNSYTPETASTPFVKGYISKIDFNYRTDYKYLKSDSNLDKELYKQRAYKAFGDEVKMLLESGKKPNKKFLTNLKTRIQKKIGAEMNKEDQN